MAKNYGSSRTRMPSNNPQLKGVGNTKTQKDHPEPGYNKEVEYIMNNGYVSRDVATNMFNTIENWAESDYIYIRAAQEGRTFDPRYVEKAETLERFIKAMPKWDGGTTFRGLNGASVRDYFDMLNIGDIFEANSLASWSSNEGVAEDFAETMFNGPTAIILRCPHPQNGTSIKYLGGLHHENEIITSGRCRYTIESKQIVNDVLYVDLKPIANKKK